MRRLQNILILIIGLTILSCSSSNKREPANKYEKFIFGLLDLQNQIDLRHDSIDSTYYCDLDFNTYFEYFNQLSIDSNWTLESHYRHFGDAGRPLLLAFEKNDSIANNLKQELSKNKKELEGEFGDWNLSKRLFNYQDSIDYLTPIHIESDSGYFQFLIFAMLGDNYCKFWHSNYGHLDIITSLESIKEVTELDDDFYYNFSKSEKEKALGINPIPNVENYNDSVTVRIVTLGPWDGFIERKFSISKKWPHKLRQYENNVLVEYDCGIMF